MTPAEIEIAKLVVAILGTIVVVSFWNWLKHRLEQYRYLDATYREILKAYIENPKFGEPVRTKAYKQKFKKDYWKYHYFAMQAHTFLETIFDLSICGWIPAEWKKIFRHHSELHSAWLRDNEDLHEAGYLRKVLGK